MENKNIGITIKLPTNIGKKIDDLLNKDKHLKLEYKSRNNFVRIAVENELRIAYLKSGLSPPAREHFNLLNYTNLHKSYEKAKEYDTKS